MAITRSLFLEPNHSVALNAERSVAPCRLNCRNRGHSSFGSVKLHKILNVQIRHTVPYVRQNVPSIWSLILLILPPVMVVSPVSTRVTFQGSAFRLCTSIALAARSNVTSDICKK